MNMANLHMDTGTHTRFESDPAVLHETIKNLMEELRKAQDEVCAAREANGAQANQNPNLDGSESPDGSIARKPETSSASLKRAQRWEVSEAPRSGTRNPDPNEVPPLAKVCAREAGTVPGRELWGSGEERTILAESEFYAGKKCRTYSFPRRFDPVGRRIASTQGTARRNMLHMRTSRTL
ncbi:hypothetical protein R1sor_013687 [Riccia sorocarpa]|uniref:Uncharacterized protein n=1 Tax=Riccia sorocarpa TaxID=122646 RepID=A0ABD3H7A6_9MARC